MILHLHGDDSQIYNSRVFFSSDPYIQLFPVPYIDTSNLTFELEPISPTYPNLLHGLSSTSAIIIASLSLITYSQQHKDLLIRTPKFSKIYLLCSISMATTLV